MPNIFRCPACGRELEVPDEAAGATGTCRFCGAEITAPAGPGLEPVLLRPGNGPPAAAFQEPGLDQPTGYLDIGAILSEAWGYLKVHWATLLAAEMVSAAIAMAILLPFLVPFIIAIVRAGPKAETMMTDYMNSAWVSVVMYVAGFLLQPIIAGPLYVADRIIARGDASLGAVFAGFRHYRALILFGTLVGAPVLVLTVIQAVLETRFPIVSALIALVSFVPQMFIYVSLQPGLMEVVDRGADAVSALKASWEFTKGHRWMILATNIVIGLAYMAGMFACCVGIFFTIGFIPLGTVLVYRHLRGLQGTPDA